MGGWDDGLVLIAPSTKQSLSARIWGGISSKRWARNEDRKLGNFDIRA